MLALLGQHVSDAARATETTTGSTGWIHCVIPVDASDAGLRELLILGDEMEIVAPLELRDQVKRILERMLALHTTPKPQARAV